MRRLTGLFVAPELLADHRFDCCEKLLASLIHGDDTGHGSDVTNDEAGAILGVSVSKIKTAVAALLTAEVISYSNPAGNDRRLHSRLGAYIDRRRRELGEPAGPAPVQSPALAPREAPAATPAAPGPVAAAVAPANGKAAGLFGPIDTGPDDGGLTDEAIYKAYPKKVKREEGLKAIGKARDKLAKQLKAAGHAAADCYAEAGRILLRRTEAYATVKRAELAAGKCEPGHIKYPQGFYNEGYWDTDYYERLAQGGWNGGSGDNPERRQPRRERGHHAESIDLPTA